MAGIGAVLRDARAERGVSLAQAAQETRISSRFLEALEDERFDDLPAPVYVRGFLRSYANYLRIDPQELIAGLPASYAVRPPVPPDMSARGAGHPPLPAARDPWSPRPRRGLESPGPAETWLPERGDAREVDDEDEPLPAAASPQRFRRARVEPLVIDDDLGFADQNEDGDDDGYEETDRLQFDRGALMEQSGDSEGRFMRLALVGLAAVAAVGLAGGLYFFFRGSEEGSNNAGGLDLPTRTSVSSTIQVGPTVSGTRTGTPATGTPSGSPAPTGSPSPTGTSSPSPTPGTPSATPTTGPRTPTATAEATATQGPTDTPEPTAAATATPPPPTSTPVPATATPIPAHPFGIQECINSTCGAPPIRVVCAPDGWFVDRRDVGGVFPAETYGWRVIEVSSAGDVFGACG